MLATQAMKVAKRSSLSVMSRTLGLRADPKDSLYYQALAEGGDVQQVEKGGHSGAHLVAHSDQCHVTDDLNLSGCGQV